MANPGRSRGSALKYTGHQNLRYRILLSLLSQRSLHITSIRSNLDNPGIRDYEVSFLRLVERLTNGTVVEISYTGTEIFIRPGMLMGGNVVHQCPESRAVGWFLEPLLVAGLFGKKDLKLTLKGVTSNQRDVSADTLRTSYLPHLSTFLPESVSSPLELRILKRGLLPLGGGEIIYSSPSIRAVRPGYNFIASGSVLKVRGIAHSVRVSPNFSQRLVNGAKEVLSPLCGDARIYTDVYRGQESGKSPGYGITLVATSTTSAVHSAEAISAVPSSSSSIDEKDSPDPLTPEELGSQCAFSLLANIASGSCIDAGMEWMVILLMALGSEDVGRVKLATPLSEMTIRFMRDVKDAMGVGMKIRPLAIQEEEENPAEQVVVSCVGVGYTNVAKKSS